jgi:divalent metal cation (Fe/Co/Zn/Cd) transporter
MLLFSVAGDLMSRTDWVCLGVIILGLVLTFYGANFYDALIGWVGAYLFLGGILAIIVFYIYGELTKKAEVQNP